MTVNWRAAAIAGLVGLLAACADEVEKPKLSFEIRPIESFDSPLWTGTIRPDDPVVASVEGTPITASMLERQMARWGPDAKPREVLERMIEFELLAREAFKAGMYDLEVVGEAMRQTLARRWVEVHLEEQVSPQDIPAVMVSKAYAAQEAYFDHFTGFKIQDMQIICCHQKIPTNCYKDLFPDEEDRLRHLDECLDLHKPAIEAAYAMAKERELTRERFEQTYQAVRLTAPSPDLKATYHTHLANSEYQFQYDINSTYEKQFEIIRYRKFFKEIMDGVRNAYVEAGEKVPLLIPPIRSRVGWHLLLIYEVVPEEHRKLTDPDVQKEIREAIFDLWRTSELRRQLGELCQRVGCELQYEALEPLQRLDSR